MWDTVKELQGVWGTVNEASGRVCTVNENSVFVILYFLPINQSPSHIIQLYGKGDYFSLISLERLGILFGFLE